MPIRKKISRLIRRFTGEAKRSTVNKSVSFEEPPLSTSPATPEKSSPSSVHKATDSVLDLVLYGRPSCPYCARVDRVIEELGVEEKITRRLTTYGSQWRMELKNRTGSTQVPCLFINGEPMFESLDIIDWLRTQLN